MNRALLITLLLVPMHLLAAVGDITGVAIETNGWQALVYISGLGTNGTYSYGLGANNTLTGAEKLRISFTSQGFDDTGTAITVPRSVVGTYRVRKPYPDQAAADEVLDAGVLRLRIALSDYVYSGDSNLTATIASGLYAQGGTNCASASVAITNGSSMAHSAPIANWTWPGWQRVTNSSMTVRAVAFHRSATRGRPVRVVRFTASDQHSHSVTSYVAAMTIDRTVPDAVPIQEYVAALDVSSFTDGDLVRCDFAAFPWWGSSATDTADGVNARPTPYYAPLTNKLDLAGAYGSAWAIVDPAGNDSTGIASTNWIVTQTNAFLTINGALLAIKGTNNTKFGHNDVGAGVVYLNAGSYSWTGGSGSYSTKPAAWVTVTRYPTCSVDQVSITNQTGLLKICDRDRIHGITLSGNLWKADNVGVFYNSDALWFDQCAINVDSGVGATRAIHRQIAELTATHCTVTEFRSGSGVGFGPFADKAGACGLIRGNVMNGTGKNVPYVWIGNRRGSTNAIAASTFLVDDVTTGNTLAPARNGTIVAYNDLRNLWWLAGAGALQFGSGNGSNGLALVQNVFEKLSDDGQYLVKTASDSQTVPTRNFLIWYNSAAGQRWNIAYNDTGSSPVTHLDWSVRGNLMDDWNIKTDTLTTSPNGSRVGNWAAVFGVGWAGNMDATTAGVGVPGDFGHQDLGSSAGLGFLGLASIQTGGANSASAAGWVTRGSFDGASNGTGGGNYMRSGAAWNPANVAGDWLIPYDLNGHARGALDPPGAFSSASPPKGAGFFQ